MAKMTTGVGGQRGMVQIGAAGALMAAGTGILGMWLWLVVDQRGYDTHAATQARQQCESSRFDADFAKSRGSLTESLQKRVETVCAQADAMEEQAKASATAARDTSQGVIAAIWGLLGVEKGVK